MCCKAAAKGFTSDAIALEELLRLLALFASSWTPRSAMLPLKSLLDASLKLAPPPRDDVRDEGRGVKFRKENGHANEEVEAYDLLLFSPPLQREESTSMDTQRLTIPPSSSSCTYRPPRGGAQLCASIDTMLRRGLLLHIYLPKNKTKKEGKKPLPQQTSPDLIPVQAKLSILCNRVWKP